MVQAFDKNLIPQIKCPRSLSEIEKNMTEFNTLQR